MSSEGVATDPDKVRDIVDITEQDLMEDGSGIPSQTKLRSFLGMVVFYQQYIEVCSHIGRPLFAFTSGHEETEACQTPEGYNGRQKAYIIGLDTEM